MATVIIQFRVNGGAVQTGTAGVAAEDEIDLRLASYSGLQSIRYEIQEYPADFAEPSGWSTDASSGAYYYNAGPIAGLTPPTITMPTALEVAAGQWGKWVFRAIGTTATGTLTSDPRCGVRIESPNLGLRGIAFTEEDEFNAQRAWTGDLQEDLVEIDAAALVSGGYVSSLAATRPIKVSAATGAVTASWEPNADVNNQGYGFTSCTGIANAAGAVAITAGSGAATMTGSTTASVTASGGGIALTGSTTAALTATAGALTCTAGTSMSLSCASGTLSLASDSLVAISPTATITYDDSSTDSPLDLLTLTRTTDGTAANGIGASIAVKLETTDGTATTSARTTVDLLDATAASATGQYLVRLIVDGDLTDVLAMRGATMRIHGLAGGGSQFLTVDNNGDVSATSSAGAPTDAPFLTNGAVGGLSAEVNIQALASTLTFASSAALPVQLTYTNASTNTMLDVLDVRRPSTTVGATGAGAGIVLYTDDEAGTDVQIGRLSAALTDASVGAHASSISLWAADGGSLVEACRVLGTGYVTASTGFDILSAGALEIGKNIATSVHITPNTTIDGTLAAGVTTLAVDDATTNNVSTVLTLRHTTSGTPASGIGARLVFESEDAAGNTEVAAYITATLADATNGSEDTRIGFWTRAGGAAATERFYHTHSDPAIGSLALVADTFVAANGNYFRLYNGASRGGMNLSGNDIRIVASTDGIILFAGATNRIKVESTGVQTHSVDNWLNIVTTSSSKTKVESQGSFSGSNTTATVWSYALPSTCVGSIEMTVDMVDVTAADDFAHYTRKYHFKRRSGGAVTLTNIGTDLVVETSDASWNAAITESGGTLSLQVTYDASNQTDGGGRVTMELTTYTAA
jgi:hypothetical protein